MKFFDFILSQRDSQRFIAKLNDKSFTVEEIEQAINLFKKKFDLRERTSENRAHQLFMEVYKNDNYALIERFKLRLSANQNTEANTYRMAAEPENRFGK